jgi:hypothetical protein
MLFVKIKYYIDSFWLDFENTKFYLKKMLLEIITQTKFY